MTGTGTNQVIIVGSGLSGLGVAHFLDRLAPGIDMLILEKGERPGGAIRSWHEQGYLAEWGAHGFLDNVAASRELLADTGLEREAQKAPLGSFVRYLCLGGRLVMVPQSPLKIAASPIMPFPGKLRVLADLWQKPIQEEQSVSAWAAHRFGPAIVPLVDAVFTGTYAGDADRLSIDAVMPGVRRLELEAGSVIRGLLRRKKQAGRTAPVGDRGPAAAKRALPSMVSFPRGMERLTEVLATGRHILFNTAAASIRKKEELWEVKAGDRTFRAPVLVLALSINQSLALLREAALGEPPPVTAVPEAAIVNVVMGFTDRARIPFGFGYLAPEQEKRFALGALFSTHMFPGRAPAGHVMLEALVGGRRHPEKLDLSDGELLDRTYADLAQLIDLPEKPCYVKVLRPRQGIPQLEMGYPRLLAWRETMLRRQAGLHVCGFGWEGIGINDMTKTAKAVAEAILAGRGEATGQAEVKGVYF